MFFEEKLINEIVKISQIFKAKQLKISVAESCSGGLLSALFTEISGASEIFDCGFVVYSNASKEKMLGVKAETLKEFGAVSKEVASEMALGALEKTNADISLAITGIAGPNSDCTKKPVGLVYIAIAKKTRHLQATREAILSNSSHPQPESEAIQNLKIKKFNFAGNRSKIREETLAACIDLLLKI
jgi:PncC family amidohydrolase